MKSNEPLRAVIVGLGSIGRRHLANLRALRPDAEIAILRHNRNTPADTDPSADHPVFYDITSVGRFCPHVALLANPYSVSLDTPTFAICGWSSTTTP